ncbi:hypothetical protein CWC28_21650, partial [Pseudoalteromonas sp. S4492]|uniref:hypothetical protein n=1 Tax=Pseudoalteromonas sp. S4492 TaxID=579560 RepID=UPI00126F368B
YGANTFDSSFVHTSLAVDLTITSVWLPLVSAKSVFFSDRQGDIQGISQYLESAKNVLIKLTPTQLRALQNYIGDDV